MYSTQKTEGRRPLPTPRTRAGASAWPRHLTRRVASTSVRGRVVPVPGLRLCGRAVSAPAQSAAALALAGREAGRLPHLL